MNTLERQTWGERRAIISWPKHLLRPCPLASLIGQSLEPEFTREYIPVVASHLPKAIHVITPRWMAKSCCCTCCVTHQFPEFANPLVSPWASKTSIDSRSTYYSVPFLNARPHGSRLARKDSPWGRWELNWREFDLFVVMWTYTYTMLGFVPTESPEAVSKRNTGRRNPLKSYVSASTAVEVWVPGLQGNRRIDWMDMIWNLVQYGVCTGLQDVLFHMLTAAYMYWFVPAL